MGTRKYLIVVDTTHSPVPTQFPSAIIDVQLLSATDETHARQLFLRSIPHHLANQLQHNLYIFDIETLTHQMDMVEQNGGTPAFKFVLPGNRRPPRSVGLENRVTIQSGNQTLTQPNDSRTMDNRNPVIPPVPVPPTRNEVIAQANKSVRSAEFQQKEYVSRTTPEILTEEQSRLVQRLGANQRLEGSNEAVSGQINSSIGRNVALTSQEIDYAVANTVTPEQAALLAKLGATAGTQIVQDPELMREVAELTLIAPDPSLAEIPADAPLSDAEIARLQEEL